MNPKIFHTKDDNSIVEEFSYTLNVTGVSLPPFSSIVEASVSPIAAHDTTAPQANTIIPHFAISKELAQQRLRNSIDDMIMSPKVGIPALNCSLQEKMILTQELILNGNIPTGEFIDFKHTISYLAIHRCLVIDFGLQRDYYDNFTPSEVVAIREFVKSEGFELPFPELNDEKSYSVSNLEPTYHTPYDYLHHYYLPYIQFINDENFEYRLDLKTQDCSQDHTDIFFISVASRHIILGAEFKSPWEEAELNESDTARRITLRKLAVQFEGETGKVYIVLRLGNVFLAVACGKSVLTSIQFPQDALDLQKSIRNWVGLKEN
ncbi:hypothetical protein HK098_003365 [Nowakowskiella sp. JEL0407]|nr:hypothetical protein HK098_003365 [Nowakowskiella sp. JEL0407]